MKRGHAKRRAHARSTRSVRHARARRVKGFRFVDARRKRRAAPRGMVLLNPRRRRKSRRHRNAGPIFSGWTAPAAAPKRKRKRKSKHSKAKRKHARKHGRRRSRRHAGSGAHYYRVRRGLKVIYGRGKGKRRRARAVVLYNPRRKRHSNPRRRRHHNRRHSNPIKSLRSPIKLPKVAGVDLTAIVDVGIEAACVGAGAFFASWLPQQAAAYLPNILPAGYAWNQGYVGVVLSGVSTAVGAKLAHFASPRASRAVLIGGGLTTLFRLVAQLAPAQAFNMIPADIKALPMAAGMAAAPAVGAQARLQQGYGDAPYFSASDIIRGERGLRDWVQTAALPSTGIRSSFRSPGLGDWVGMDGAAASSKTGAESF